jgi:hypothetical protein
MEKGTDEEGRDGVAARANPPMPLNYATADRYDRERASAGAPARTLHVVVGLVVVAFWMAVSAWAGAICCGALSLATGGDLRTGALTGAAGTIVAAVIWGGLLLRDRKRSG